MSLPLLYLDFGDDTVLRIFMFIIPPISIVNNRTPFETELSDYAAVDMRAHRVLEFFFVPIFDVAACTDRHTQHRLGMGARGVVSNCSTVSDPSLHSFVEKVSSSAFECSV